MNPNGRVRIQVDLPVVEIATRGIPHAISFLAFGSDGKVRDDNGGIVGTWGKESQVKPVVTVDLEELNHILLAYDARDTIGVRGVKDRLEELLNRG